ncbi:MAG: signal recognition particle-docking protein FtsY [Methylococcaceae bacterium]|nr:signal recognition particle-docking protein FtsY [Methylococcaceae bacterium]
MFRNVVLISVVLALLVILAGSFVRLSGSELACPDWPACFGQITLNDESDFSARAKLLFPDYSVDFEKVSKVIGHRYLTAFLSLLVILLNLFSWRKQHYRLAAFAATTSLILLLAGQVILSVSLVKLHAMPLISGAHLMVSILIFWLLFWLYLRSQASLSAMTSSSGPLGLSRFVSLILLLQIILGIWVSVNQAGLACQDFPTCNGEWWPKADYKNGVNIFYGLFTGDTGIISLEAQVAVNWLHRVGSLISFALFLCLIIKSVASSSSKPIRRSGLFLSVLVLIQLATTIVGIKTGMSIGLALAHEVSSVLLMLPLISISFYSRYSLVDLEQPVIEYKPKPEITEAKIETLSVEDLYVEPPQESLLSRLKLQLKRTRTGLGGILASLPFGEKDINDDLLEEIEASLIMADVGIDTTSSIINRLTQQLERLQLRDGLALSATLKQELLSILKPCNKPLLIPEQNKPFVILVVGVNGAGKTTTIGKLAKRLQAQGRSVMLAAGDTFRAAAVEQLQVWGERNNIHVVAQHTGADSASVIYDGLQSAQAKGVDVLIADTAGRLHTKSNLMDELKKVKRIMGKLDESAPHEVLLVLDAGTGQNALSQAKLFNETVKLTGLVLTKLDGTAKGGVIFALAKQTGIPIRYIGIGEGIDDLQDFDAENFVDALFVKD